MLVPKQPPSLTTANLAKHPSSSITASMMISELLALGIRASLSHHAFLIQGHAFILALGPTSLMVYLSDLAFVRSSTTTLLAILLVPAA